jgi:hypothetical protein
MTSRFKDFFSRDPARYAEYRPGYPAELFDWLAGLPAHRRLAWDAGTGNGQAAVGLAAHFDRVVASDASAGQLARATPHPRVEYREAGETIDLESGSVDLVTVAQALHWFDRPRFWTEVKRVMAAGGAVAVWCYELQQITPEIDQVIGHFYRVTVGPWWTPDRKLVEERYQSIEFPFREIPAPDFAMSADWTLEQELGYLGTWSAVSRAASQTGLDPLDQVRPLLEAAWPRGARLQVRWPIAVRAGR